MKRITKYIIGVLMTCNYGLVAQDTIKCPVIGKPKSARTEALNILKNRDISTAPLNKTVSLDTILKSGSDSTRFGSSWYISVTGWVVGYEDEGPQSCNCYSHDQDNQGLILYIARSLGSWKDSIFTVVVSAKYKHSHGIEPDSLFGQKVTLSGYMLYDFEREKYSLNSCKNCNKASYKTAWQINPVVAIKKISK